MQQDKLNPEVIAERLLADYDACKPHALFAEGFRLDLADAWRVQTAVTRLREARGERVTGYKVGAVTPINQQMMGLPHPVWGRLWDSELHDSGAALRKDQYANIAIEAEFGITLSADLPSICTIDEIAAAVDAVYPTLELHNLMLGSERPHGPELLANNCINCGVVRGAPIKELASHRNTDLKLVYDGVVVDEWESLSWPDDILGAVSWLSGSLGQHGIALKAGDLLLTSAWGPPIPVAEATQVDVTSSAFGQVTATFQ